MDLEFRELVGFQFLATENEPHHVLRQQSEGAQVEHFVAVFVDEFQHLRSNRQSERTLGLGLLFF